ARSEAQGSVGDMSRAHGQVADAHGRVRGLAAADAVEPVAEVAHGAVAQRAHLHLRLRRERPARLLALFIEHEQALPVDLERTLDPAALEASVVDAAAVGPGVRYH